ncbi:MAG: Hsp70 family protein [Oscillospiraceae bacterium]|nr:Hsp70 family protein [Oscillospiraceae bacterium]
MINIGIDFGSTYTMVSVYEKGKGVPVTVQPDGLSYSYPSIVVYDSRRDRYICGKAARSRVGGKDTVTYRGFKMLLNQQMSEENLALRGYDKVNTPEKITEEFLRYVIQNTLDKKGESKVGTLVIGAPECWFQSIQTVDARGTLREICRKMPNLVEEVKIISEPTNAAAFCVWNYEQQFHEPLNGRILVVDYGGGTLDTALVNVRQQKGQMQIKPEMRSGAGENHDNKIGEAGIAFQEAVARRAISEALDIPGDSIPYDAHFNQFLKDFEEQLLSQSDYVSQSMQEFSFAPDGLRDITLCGLTYDGEPVDIDLYQLYSCYQEHIHPVLQRVLDETTTDLKDPKNLRIALVGGFCNFYLVRKQIYDYFKIAQIDDRTKGMIREEAQRETAIAHGAALFADNVLSVCNIAQFSIGTYATYPDGRRFNRFAINYGQEIEPDQIYFALDDRGEPFPMTSGSIDKFLLNFGRKSSTAIDVQPKPEFAAQLQSVPCGMVVVIGFSMDACDRITVHVFNYDIEHARRDPKPTASLPLSTLKDMFESIVLTGLGGS